MEELSNGGGESEGGGMFGVGETGGIFGEGVVSLEIQIFHIIASFQAIFYPHGFSVLKVENKILIEDPTTLFKECEIFEDE